MTRRWSVLSLPLFVAAGCAHAGEAPTVEVETVVTNVAHHIDGRDWSNLRSLFADEVETDYTSLFGGEVQSQPSDDLMAAWKSLLTPVVTQHQLGPITVDITNDRATAHCHVRGYHYLANAPGGDQWMVAGHYVFQLRRVAGAWKIEKMKLETFYQTGNEKLLQEAAKPTADSPS